jgi:hypothetical protein
VEQADQAVNPGHHVELHAPDKQSLAASIATLLLTLPALGKSRSVVIYDELALCA